MARLLVVALALLLGAAPGEPQAWASEPAVCQPGGPHNARDVAGAPVLALAAAPDLVFAAPFSSSDGDDAGLSIASHPRDGGHRIEPPHAGYQLPHGQLLTTAFAPRGPPRA